MNIPKNIPDPHIPFYYKHKILGILFLAVKNFVKIDGFQRAAAFSYYTLFSIVPLIMVIVVTTSFFVNTKKSINYTLDFFNEYSIISDGAKQNVNNIINIVDNGITANNIISYVNQNFIPVSPKIQIALQNAINNMIKGRKGVGIISLVFMLWGASFFLNVLVHAINRAWNISDRGWHKVPIKNLMMLLILTLVLFIGILAPAVFQGFQQLFPRFILSYSLTLNLALLLVPQLSLFLGFLLLYKFAPDRKMLLSEVWFAALMVTAFLQLAKNILMYITINIVDYSVLFGTLGSIMALLMWIYFSGIVIILGGCICAAQFEVL